MRLRRAQIGIALALVPVQTQAQAQRLEMHPFSTVTLTAEQFLAGVNEGTPAVIAAELRLPRISDGRLPAVILVHGSSGVGPTVDGWARELNSIGVAALLLDSFTGRGITSTGSDQAQLHHLAMIEDAYRALDWLARDSRIDPSRIALMGFSKGGFVALYASLKRFQRMHAPAGVQFAAYLPFYAPCNYTFVDEEEVADRPIRLFHGAADDFTPVASCRDYVTRLRRAGKDVELTEYPAAYHSFDNPSLPPALWSPDAQWRGPDCWLIERGGHLVARATGRPFTWNDACVQRGAHVGYNAEAHHAAVLAVKTFLTAAFRLKNDQLTKP